MKYKIAGGFAKEGNAGAKRGGSSVKRGHDFYKKENAGAKRPSPFDGCLKERFKTLLKIWRGKNNTAPLSEDEALLLSKALLQLQRGLTGERNLVGAPYMQDKSLLGAYLLYYWPVSYMQISFCIQYFSDELEFLVKERCENGAAVKKEFNVLDAGCGPAPASFAVTDFLLKMNPALKVNVDLLDSSFRALNLAQRIFEEEYPVCEEDCGKPSLKQGDAVTKAGRVNVSVKEANLEQSDFSFLQNKYDFIVVSHALNELWKDSPGSLQKKEALLLSLTCALKEDGILLLCEPSLLQTSRTLIKLRNALVKNGLRVLSPCCLNQSECPALASGENQTCHAEVEWTPLESVALLANLAKLDRTSVKMTFFAFTKKSESRAQDSLQNVYTVVSDPMLNKAGRVRLLLCNGKERISFSAKKDDASAKKAGFFNLKRYCKIALEQAELRGTKESPSYGFGEGTKIIKGISKNSLT